MSNIRVGHFPTTTITWSDGSNFNGYFWFGIVPPNYTGTDTSIGFGNYLPQFNVPLVAPIPVVNGLINSSQGLFYNADLMPPNSKYIMRIYDSTKKNLLYGPSTPFIVNSDPISLPSYGTLTVPSVGSVGPTPDS